MQIDAQVIEICSSLSSFMTMMLKKKKTTLKKQNMKKHLSISLKFKLKSILVK